MSNLTPRVNNLEDFDTSVNQPNSPIVKTALNASGDAPIYACRAWVNFNGTGVVAIRESGNVSSITDNGVGDYTANFVTPIEDENYAVTFAVNKGVINVQNQWIWYEALLTSSVNIRVYQGSSVDASVSIAIFR